MIMGSNIVRSISIDIRIGRHRVFNMHVHLVFVAITDLCVYKNHFSSPYIPVLNDGVLQ